jgi:hypothetical protein
MYVFRTELISVDYRNKFKCGEVKMGYILPDFGSQQGVRGIMLCILRYFMVQCSWQDCLR